MRVLMTGGGTAGHINPALAIADIIKEKHPDAEVLFVGATGRMETRLVPAAGYALKTVDVRGFQRRITLKNIGRNLSAAVHVLTSSIECAKILNDFRPDIAIGTGGYVSGPILRKAAKMGIPMLVHESNAFPGLAVRMLAKYADAVLIAEEAARKFLPENARVIVTGNPLRGDFLQWDKAKARRELGLDARPVVLSYGGSLGAQKLNDIMSEVLVRSAKEGTVQHIHATGKAGFASTTAKLKAQGIEERAKGIWIREYIDDMPRCMAAADLVISRAGAMTISELPAAGKPAILIPSPNVAENHQYHNAMALVNKGAAVCIEESSLSADTLWKAIHDITASPETMRQMSECAKQAATFHAAERIYEVIMSTLHKAPVSSQK